MVVLSPLLIPLPASCHSISYGLVDGCVGSLPLYLGTTTKALTISQCRVRRPIALLVR